jgi:hypothetical protein
MTFLRGFLIALLTLAGVFVLIRLANEVSWQEQMGGLSVSHIVLVLAAIAIFCALYILPSFIAFKRRHHNRAAILGLNILLGWTVLGWVAAFVWALTAVQPAKSA